MGADHRRRGRGLCLAGRARHSLAGHGARHLGLGGHHQGAHLLLLRHGHGAPFLGFCLSNLLVGVGRTPNTDGIGLEQAGVKLTETGYIAVDECLATTAASVWAMGECAGSPQFTHASFDDFRVVYDNLNGGSSTTMDRLVPYCMYTDPEVARVGWNESEARRRGIGSRLLPLPMAAVLRTRTLSEPRGFMKMLIAADSDEILGFTVFGAEASELMAAVQTAMIGRIPYTALRSAIYAHPTVAEGLTFLLRNTPTAPAR